MSEFQVCKYYLDENYPNYLVEYRGDFLEEIKKVDYACGDIINDTFAVISVQSKDLNRLIADVPSILFVDFRNIYLLENVDPSTSANIEKITINPYLNLTGRGVIIGIVDTGIDYLNEAFIRADGTSRILTIWDQTQTTRNTKDVFIGSVYENEDINKAILLKKTGGDPYLIVPEKDEYGHGTKVAGIIAANNHYEGFSGVAPEADIAVVKLTESRNYKKMIEVNNIAPIPIYNTSQILSGVEYLVKYSKRVNKPLILYLGLGTTDNSHDGNSLFSRYLNELALTKRITTITSVGNEADKDGHVSGYIVNEGDIKEFELKVSRTIPYFQFRVWIKRPNKMSINIIAPSGEESRFIKAKFNQYDDVKYINENCSVKVTFYIPDNITGNQVINLNFTDIRPGIWKFQLRADYVIDGRYDAWLPQSVILPPGTKFLNPDPNTTLTIPSTSKGIISVGYYNSEKNILNNISGKGFNVTGSIKPDIIAPGENILTTMPGGGATTISGSSAAAAIVAGACALLLQWGIVLKNDPDMFPKSIKTYLITGADRSPAYLYPNKTEGYGKLDFQGVFDTLSGKIKNSNKLYREYSINSVFIRAPRDMMEVRK